MRDRRRGDASFWMGIVFGIFLGAAIALLLTPDTGEKNRAKLVEKAQETVGSIEGRIRDTQEKTG